MLTAGTGVTERVIETMKLSEFRLYATNKLLFDNSIADDDALFAAFITLSDVHEVRYVLETK